MLVKTVNLKRSVRPNPVLRDYKNYEDLLGQKDVS